jgi:Predicted protein tyrosine phosphatase
MQKLYCYSANEFKQTMDGNKWTNRTLPSSVACIEICATPDVRDYYGQLFSITDKPWFLNRKSLGPVPENVLKLNFDDITESVRPIGEDKFAYGMNVDQAKQIVEFIDKNIDKDFYIHCHAGKSRSQAIVRYILDFYPDHDWETRPENPCMVGLVNGRVYSLLRMVKCGYESSSFLDDGA